MKSMNLHIIKGTLGRDARINKVGERSVANFSVATEYEYKDKSNNWAKETTWHNVCAWQGFGICDLELLVKGARVLVTGRERLRTYTDRDGKEVSSMELVADTVDIIGPDKAEKPSKNDAKPQGGRNYKDEDEDF